MVLPLAPPHVSCSCAALDEIGDTSSEEERRRYFQDVDTDKSEGIDFEEFINVSI